MRNEVSSSQSVNNVKFQLSGVRVSRNMTQLTGFGYAFRALTGFRNFDSGAKEETDFAQPRLKTPETAGRSGTRPGV